MTYQFMELDETHGHQLLQLAKKTNTGSNLFYVDRYPNYFRLTQEFGQTRHFGLFKGTKLIGCVAVSQHNRLINGTCENVYYLNDLRVHPHYHRTLAYYRLIKQLITLYQNEETVKWMFSTVLDSNTNVTSMIKGNGLLPSGIELGKTVHIGLPMFMKYKKNNSFDVVEVTGEEAWPIYKNMARFQLFAPCEKELFLKEKGVFLVVRNEKKENVAICKLVDQSNARKLRLSRKLPFSFRIMNIFCRLAGCPVLPEQGEEFRHGYLAYFVARETPQIYRHALISYIQKTYTYHYTYLFFGASEEEARRYKKHLFQTRLSSTTFAYGEIPVSTLMDFHELTLI